MINERMKSLSINEMTEIQYAVEAHQGVSEIPAFMFICAEALQQGILVKIIPTCWNFSR